MKELAEGSGLAVATTRVWFPTGTIHLIAQRTWDRETAVAVRQRWLISTARAHGLPTLLKRDCSPVWVPQDRPRRQQTSIFLIRK